MDLSSHRTCNSNVSATARHALQVLACAIFFLVCMLAVRPAHAQEGGVYISGQGASLHEAFDQALAENANGSTQPFWVIVSGYDIVRLTKTGANRDVLEPIQRIRERRGLVYVCLSDMSFYGVKEDDLLEGIKAIRGLSAGDQLNGLLNQPGIVMPKNMPLARRILRTCADRDEADMRGVLWTALDGRWLAQVMVSGQ